MHANPPMSGYCRSLKVLPQAASSVIKLAFQEWYRPILGLAKLGTWQGDKKKGPAVGMHPPPQLPQKDRPQMVPCRTHPNWHSHSLRTGPPLCVVSTKVCLETRDTPKLASFHFLSLANSRTKIWRLFPPKKPRCHF